MSLRDITATVAGTAQVEAVPDLAHLDLLVKAEEPSSKLATESFATTLAKTRALLDGTGGCSYRISSMSTWETQKRKRPWHEVWCHVSAEVTELPGLSGLFERVDEIPGLSIGRLDWRLSNRRQLLREARVAAIGEAREAADDYAAALGLRVAQVLGVNDPEANTHLVERPMVLRASARAGGPAELDLSNPEPVSVDGHVVVTFLLTDGS